MEYVDKIIEYGSMPAVGVVLANLITMFIDDKKVAKADKVIQIIVRILNILSMNVLKNANKGTKP